MTVQDLPPHLYGKGQRHDLGLGLVMTAARLFAQATALIPLRRMAAGTGSDALVLDVVARGEETADGSVVSIVLAAPDDAPLPPWWPGAHLDVHLPSGRMRTYSLCGDFRDRRRYRIAVRRIADGGGGSLEAHEVLQVGSSVTIRGPRNAFAFAPPGAGSLAPRVRFVAGGIGITPILAMITLCEARGIDWSLVLTGRDERSLPFLAELALYGDRVTVWTDAAHGLPTAAALLDGVAPGDAVYCCGPPPMVDLVRAGVRDLPGTELHVERFSADLAGGEAEGGTVTFARSGTRVAADGATTLLEAGEGAGVALPFGCRMGICHSCVVPLRSGAVRDLRDGTEHRVEENHPASTIQTCVTAAAGDCVLDI